MPLIITKKKTKYFRGEGFFDSLLSAVTSKVVQDTVKEAATNVGKKALTDLGNKASEKVINKIFPPSNGEARTLSDKTNESQEVKLLAEQLFPRGSGSIRRI